MQDSHLSVSIITICLNSESTIEITINSVISQTYPHIEYIIIDGGSTDNTLEIIQQYRSKIHLFISEKDRGIYDAMNKGVDRASGDIIYFLNSGDYFYNKNVIETMAEQMEEFEDTGIFIGDTILYDTESEERISGFRQDKIEYIARVVNHQAIFARNSVFEKIGGFDIKYKIYSDYDWLLRALFKFDIKVKYIPVPVSRYLKGGLSDTKWKEFIFERREIFQKYVSFREIIIYALRYPKDAISFFKFRYFR
jgi:glycosyltransferase involved in cell wall biosynthesis